MVPEVMEDLYVRRKKSKMVEQMEKDPQSMLLELFYFKLSTRLSLRLLQLWFEACMMTLCSLFFPYILGFSQGSVIALFLLSFSLLERMQFLIDEHRDNVWQRGMQEGLQNWKAHTLLATSAFAMFLGILVPLILFVVWLSKFGGAGKVKAFFHFFLSTISFQRELPLAERFGSFLGILGNNYLVLLSTIIITMLYRVFGLILILSWNAFVWAVVFVLLFQDALATTKMAASIFLLQAVPAVIPHLFIETFAYTVGAMAALFLSKAMSKYPISDERFRGSIKAVLRLVFAAVFLVLLGAVVESVLPAALLSSL